MENDQDEPVPSDAFKEYTTVEGKFHDYEFPKVSIIIPTFNTASTISMTIDHLLVQDYPDYEIIIIDGGSTDRTLEIVNGYREDKIHPFTVSGYHRYEMLNKGIVQATGQYINFLFPGDYYLYKDTLRYMMAVALDHHKPHLVFCGTLLRDTRTEVRTLFRHLTRSLLKSGQQPTSLQSCWFHVDTFDEVGKFDTALELRGGYDLLCRFSLHGHLRAVSVKRVLIDYDLRVLKQEFIFVHFCETFTIVYRYFGLLATLHWLTIQKDWLRFIEVWWRKLKVAFGAGKR